MKNSPDIISILNTKDIFNNSHDAFIISDSDKIISFVNRSALKMFGYSEEELIGKSIHSLMSEERTANYNKQMNEVLSGQVVSNIDSGEDLRGKRKNGEIFSIELTYVSSKSGKENYFISQIRDISERKTRESELSVALKDLKIISES
ncbi:MAG: PAS domain S-box protein, partial [Candidatus Gastranaerophilales bacterium]|nr:PAS domain S-box protein [Candidatus Gastranaerophilales bacterium]